MKILSLPKPVGSRFVEVDDAKLRHPTCAVEARILLPKGVTKKNFIPFGDKPVEVPLRALALCMHTQVMHKWAGTGTCVYAHTLVMCVAYGRTQAHYGHTHTSVMWVQWARIHKHVGILGRKWVGDGRALWAHMSALGHAQMHLHTRLAHTMHAVSRTRQSLHAQDRAQDTHVSQLGVHTQHVDAQALPRTHDGRTVAVTCWRLGADGSLHVRAIFYENWGRFEGRDGRPCVYVCAHVHVRPSKPEGFHFCTK